MGDVAQHSAVASSLTEAQIELGWNIILLCEAAFLLDAASVQRFRRCLVRRFASRFNAGGKSAVNPNGAALGQWRVLGDSYYVLHLPCCNGGVLYAKREGATLHMPLPAGLGLFASGDGATSFKDTLLTFLEFASTQDCERLRLYCPKNSSELAEIKRIVANLHWIGGRIARNEDRDAIMDSLAIDDLMTGDEEFLILEFEC